METPAHNCFRVAQVANKGNGLVATEHIVPGQLLLVEAPILVLDRGEDDIEHRLNAAVEALSQPQRSAFRDLCDSKSPAGVKSDVGIYLTNYFRLGVALNSPTAILPTIGLVNHACCGTAEVVYRPALGVSHLRATAHIAPGEEITHCYLPQLKAGQTTCSERKRTLRQSYNFDCDCMICATTEEESARHDRSRITILEIMTKRVSDLDDPRDIAKNAAICLRLMEEQRYKLTHRLDACKILFAAFMSMGNIAMAREAAGKGHSYAQMLYGKDNNASEVEEWSRRKDNPLLYVLEM